MTPAHMTAPRRRPRERAVQQQIVHLLRSLGAAVYVSGTTRPRGDYHGTCQTPGIPDLEAFLPAPKAQRRAEWESGVRGPRLLKVEVKAAGGRLRPAQAAYRAHCLAAGVAHLVGGLDDVIRWLIAEGYLRADQVPYYRGSALPTASTEA